MKTPSDEYIRKLLAQGYLAARIATRLQITLERVHEARRNDPKRKDIFPELTKEEIWRRAEIVKQESLRLTRDDAQQTGQTAQ